MLTMAQMKKEMKGNNKNLLEEKELRQEMKEGLERATHEAMLVTNV